MSAQDMRDMLGLTGEAARPAKKRKLVEKRPLEKGMAREVSALMGERAPPVSMIQVKPKYKQRPKRHVKATPWKWTAFANDARQDGLRLFHWQRQAEVKKVEEAATGTEEQSADVAAPSIETDHKPYQFARFDVQPEVPDYTDEVYESILKDEKWSKEETDYLLDLVRDFGHRWAIVWDRYDYSPPKREENDADAANPATRSVEDIKSRYYTVKAKMLARNTPIASMNGTQYSLYQTLNSFDPKQETGRKKLTEAHLYRTEAEVQEETALLAELQRIMINQTALEASRKDLRDRLDYPSSATTTQYTTSHALAQLFQQLVAADRSKKDRRLKDLAISNSQHPQSSHHRESISAAANGIKRPRESLASVSGSVSNGIGLGGASTDGPDARARALSPHSAARFFVTTLDRLNAGVTFASDKLSKPRVAKSAVQTERIAAVLTHLKIPDVIPLPTQRVVDEFDKVMAKVAGLLEMRKVAEREEQEVKVREAEAVIKKNKVAGGGGAVAGAVAGVDGANDDAAAADGAAPAGDNTEGSSTRGVKRSASVLSGDGVVEGREKRRK